MQLFKRVAREFSSYEKRREHIIKVSRSILRDGKKVIFLCHEGDLASAKKLISALARIVQQHEREMHKPLVSGRPFALYGEGSWNAAVEEYLEAWFLYNFIVTHALVEPRGITPSAEVIIGALSDFTGEITRLCVVHGAERDIQVLKQYRDVVAAVVKQLLSLHLTGQARQKFDQAKRNLKRIEEILYEVTIRT